MNLNSMFAIAKQINSYNKHLAKILPPLLNQIQIAQILDKKAIFVVANSAILKLAKGQNEIIILALNKELKLDIQSVDFQIAT